MYSRCLTIFFLCNLFLQYVLCDDNNRFFLKAAKSIPRIGRRSKASSDFEKFFLKASKSVPRIGRRNENPYPYEISDSFNESKFKYPTWAELADRYEYDPELFTSPQYLAQLEEEIGYDPMVNEWEKVRFRRSTPTNQRSAGYQKKV